MGGAKIHGYVQIKASHNDGGRHARRGCYKFTRKSGPYLDTGWLCTASASSPRDSRLLHRSSWVWDSPLWGDAYVTRFNYKADWF